MNNLDFSIMTLSDLAIISDYLESDFDNFWNANILKSELENPNSIYVVAKLNNEIVGFGGIINTLDQMEITNIVVKKSLRNQGIGNALLRRLIVLSREHGKNMIFLEVNANNLCAIKLYEKNGFQRVGLRKKYYNNADDAILMNLKIN